MDQNNTPNAQSLDLLAATFRTSAANMAALAAAHGMPGAVDGAIENYLAQADRLTDLADTLRGRTTPLASAA